MGCDLGPCLGRVGRRRRVAERRVVGEWVMGIRGDGFLIMCVLLNLTAVLGVEKMLLVPRAASEVCRMVTTTVDAFWGSSSKFRTIFGSVGLVAFDTS